jgi:site-specific DNA-cytosine methylase
MIALKRVGIPVERYFASEIDKYAIQVSKANWPNIIHIGDVTKVHYFEGVLYTEFGQYEVSFAKGLICGGSPCQGFSFAGKQLNFEDPRSKLFFEFVRIYEEIKVEHPDVKVFLENVVMKKEYQAVISKALGIEPIFINSAILSAQTRKRLYWTNIALADLPNDKGLLLKDILITEGIGIIKNREEYFERSEKAMCLDANYYKGVDNHGQRTMVFLTAAEVERAKIKYAGKVWKSGNRMGIMKFPDAINKKAKSLCSTVIKGARETIHIQDGDSIRMLYTVEAEKLQGVCEGYTSSVNDTQAYKMLGNGWNVDTIVHLFEPLLWEDIL